MRRQRYVVSRTIVAEMLPTLLLATGVSTFIFLIRAMFVLADLFISHSVRVTTALVLLLLGVPNILALTLPIGTLFAILMTAARWAADSETVAVQACGVPLWRVARPLALAAVAVFSLDLALALFFMPDANRRLTEEMRRVALSAISAAVEQRVFAEDFTGQLLYVDKIDRHTHRWHGILLFNLTEPNQESLTIADTGELTADPRDGSTSLYLQDTTTHLLRPDQPEYYRKNDNRELTIRLRQPSPDRTARGEVGVRETSTAELLKRLGASSGRSPDELREVRVELHKRVAIPAAAVVFALVGFPLGLTNRRGGKGFGLTASVMLVVLYYVLLNNGELLASSGKVPAVVGVWLPNLLLAASSVALFRRASRGVAAEGSHVWGAPVLRCLRAAGEVLQRTFMGGVKAVPAGHDEDGASREREASRRPPVALGILDRYLLRQCLGFFILVVLAVCALWITINLSESLDDIRKNSVPFIVVASYYLFSLPQILHDMLPLAFLIAFLASATSLERHNETTAFKAAGISLSRVALPLLALGLCCGVGLFLIDDQVTQKAERSKQRLEDVIKNRQVARSYRATDRPYLFLPDGRTLVNFLEFDPDINTLVRPSVYVFDERFNLRTRFMAERAVFRDGRWRAQGAWSRSFLGEGEPFTRYVGPVDLPLPVAPDYFGREYRKPAQMSFGELRDYIHTLRAAGYRVDRLTVQLHQKLAYPLSLVVLAWLSLPFAFRLGRRGTVGGIALALVLGMAYFALLVFLTRLGEAALLPPVLASWSPTVLFALFALNRHTTLRT